MIVATPVDQSGNTMHSWGRAHWVATADVRETDAGGPQVFDWRVHEVAWDEGHDAGNHGSHHATIVRFLRDNGVQAIVVDHVGEGMQRMLATMGIPMLPASGGDARESVARAVAWAVDQLGS
ncbi:MAG TPA: NifB/NifX family molybdenum-iron cluster-binding protein [Propionibacteriaceae bacterium]|nr:NifB/NifX family molybdenum-iron cluster-binding protein [Propionibacteriaceae bacterium]